MAVKHLKAAADQKYAVVHTGLINSGDYETVLAHLKRGIKRDGTGVYSYLYGDFWEHNYGGLLPWDDNRPDIASRINMAAGGMPIAICADMNPLWSHCSVVFLIENRIEPTPENIAAVEVSRDRKENLLLTHGNTTTTYFGIKPNF